MQDLYKILIFSFFLILSSSIIFADNIVEPYNDPLSITNANTLYCQRGGDCILNNLTVNAINLFNGSINFINVTIVNYNVTGELFISGNITANDYFFSNGDSLNDTYVNIVGDNMTGDLGLQGNNINEVSNITTERINSRFYDWIILNDVSRKWLFFNGTDLGYNRTTHQTEFYNKSEVDELVSAVAFDFFLTNQTSDLSGMFNMTQIGSDLPQNSIDSISLGAGNGQSIFNFSTKIPPGLPFNVLRTGIFDTHIHLQKTAGIKPVTITPRLYNISADGTNRDLLITFETSDLITSSTTGFNLHGILSEETMIDGDGRLMLELTANVGVTGSDATITVFMEGSTDSHFTLQTSTQAFEKIFLRKDGLNSPTEDISWDGNSLTEVSLSAADVDRDVAQDCPDGTEVYGFGDNYSFTKCRQGNPNGTQWNRTGNNLYPADLNDNVGIGTSNPTSKLHVIGNANITETLTANVLNITTGYVNGTPFITNFNSTIQNSIACGENAALDTGYEWSCGGNGESGANLNVALSGSGNIIGISLKCNVGTGTAEVAIFKNNIDTGCSVVSTTTDDTASCNVPFVDGDGIQPNTLSDSGHSTCVATMLLKRDLGTVGGLKGETGTTGEKGFTPWTNTSTTATLDNNMNGVINSNFTIDNYLFGKRADIRGGTSSGANAPVTFLVQGEAGGTSTGVDNAFDGGDVQFFGGTGGRAFGSGDGGDGGLYFMIAGAGGTSSAGGAAGTGGNVIISAGQGGSGAGGGDGGDTVISPGTGDAGDDGEYRIEINTIKILTVGIDSIKSLRHINISVDNQKLIMGGQGDAEIFWDGTNLRFEYNNTNNPNAVARFSGNVSATNYNVRTPTISNYQGNILDNLVAPNLMLENGTFGKLARENLLNGEANENYITDFSRPVNVSYEEEACRTIIDKDDEASYVCANVTRTKIVHPYKIKEQTMSVGDVLMNNRLMINELKTKNDLMKASLCKLGEDVWC